MVENSILSSQVTVEKGATVKDSILMSGVVVKSGATVIHSIVDENAVIGENAKIGGDAENPEIAVIGREYKVQPNATVAAGTILDANEQ